MRSPNKKRTLKGGYNFRPFKGEIDSRMVKVPIPRTAVFPMKQGYGAEVPPLVKVGDSIKAGTIIGRDDSSISTPVVSSVNGIVKEISSIDLPGGTATAVTIETNRDPTWGPMFRSYTDYRSATNEQIAALLYEGGITALGKWGLPTEHNTAAIGPETVKNIIITAIPTEPFIHTNKILLSNSLTRFAIGCEILQTLYKPEDMHLAISDKDLMLIQKLRPEMTDFKISVHDIPPVHPFGCEELVIESCLGVTVPDRTRAIDMGILVIDAQLVLHIHDAVVDGKPLIERVVALGGGAYSEPSAAIVKVGTTCEDLIAGRISENIEPRIIFDSSLTGPHVTSLTVPVDKTVKAVIALEEFRERPFMHFVRPGFDYDSKSNSFLGRITDYLKRSDTNLGGELRACINCGYCEEVCPRDLMPHYLSKCVNADLPDEAEAIRIFGCVECGLCTYVCPSKIPLMDDIIKGKELIVKEEEEYRKQLEAVEKERRLVEQLSAEEGTRDA